MTGQVFTPEPCAHCDARDTCPTHDTSPTWGDNWLHPSERKHAPRIDKTRN